MNCNCIQLLNEKLAAEGLELDTITDLGLNRRLYLRTRSNKTGQPAKKKVAINYCPQCGKGVEK